MRKALPGTSLFAAVLAIGCSGAPGDASMASGTAVAASGGAASSTSPSSTSPSSSVPSAGMTSSMNAANMADVQPATTTQPTSTTPTTAPDNPSSAEPTTEPTTSPAQEPDEPASNSTPTQLGDLVHPTEPLCPTAVVPDAPECTSNDDCTDGQTCIFDNAPTGCNLGCAGPSDECSDTQPCPDGSLCVGTPAALITSACTCGGGTYCKPACTGDDDCGPVARCEADGRCVSIGCDDGYDCPIGKLCDLGHDSADDHGCRFIRCDEPEHPGCGTNQECDPQAATTSGCTPRSCTSGAGCDCGACSPIGNVCVSRPGFCGTLAVPG